MSDTKKASMSDPIPKKKSGGGKSEAVFRKPAAKPASDPVAIATLERLAHGIPRSELKLMVSEAETCEQELQDEIDILERALEQDGDDDDDESEEQLEKILNATLTPLEKCWTLSALLGRLRGDLAMPSMMKMDGVAKLPTPPATLQQSQSLVDMTKLPAYTAQHESTQQLLTVWKKIHQHRTALVFKKPVRAEDAPGYTDRISFPMDLSLVRKLITTRRVVSFADLHAYIALISHNCVKYNGRESDYGLVARDFEAMADEAIRVAVKNYASNVYDIGGSSTTGSSNVAAGAGKSTVKRLKDPPVVAAVAASAVAASSNNDTTVNKNSTSAAAAAKSSSSGGEI